MNKLAEFFIDIVIFVTIFIIVYELEKHIMKGSNYESNITIQN